MWRQLSLTGSSQGIQADPYPSRLLETLGSFRVAGLLFDFSPDSDELRALGFSESRMRPGAGVLLQRLLDTPDAAARLGAGEAAHQPSHSALRPYPLRVRVTVRSSESVSPRGGERGRERCASACAPMDLRVARHSDESDHPTRTDLSHLTPAAVYADLTRLSVYARASTWVCARTQWGEGPLVNSSARGIFGCRSRRSLLGWEPSSAARISLFAL